MGNLKKVISLSQASKLSGYHSDYLSALIRKGEMNGQKIGGSWFTTQEEIKKYIFKQKVQHKKWAIGDFLSQKRTQNVFLLTGIILVGSLLAGTYLYGKNTEIVFEEGEKTLSPEAEIID
jgi:hypothetical protein